MPEPPEMELDFLEPFDYVEPPEVWTCRSGKYPKQIVSLALGASAGASVTLSAIEYGSMQPTGDGPGGDFVAPQTVLNRVQPTGVLNHFKWYEIVIGIQQDEFTALYDTAVSDSLNAVIMDGENAPIDYLTLTQKYAEGTPITLTFESGKCYLSGVTPNKVITEEGKYVVELKFICIGGFFAGAFLEPFDHIEPPSMDLSFTEPFDS